MFRKILGVTLALAMSPAFAGDLSYNYVQLGYQKAELDGGFGGIDVDGDGFGVGGAFEIGENWFVPVSYGTLDFDFGVQLDQLAVGLGYHAPLSNGTDFFATLSYLSAEISASGFGSLDEDGYGATVGVRGMLTDSVELHGSIGYSDLGDGADGTAFGAGALYSFSENFALGFDLAFEEDVTMYGIGARFYFGK